MLISLFRKLGYFLCLLTSVAFAADPDGSFTLNYTAADIPNNNVQLVCGCNQTNLFVPPTSATATAATFSFNAIGEQIVRNGQCPTSSISKAFYDVVNCQFESTDSTPIIYSNISIYAIGDHCMAPGGNTNGCPKPGWAIAANWQTPRTNPNPVPDYILTAPTAASGAICTKFACNDAAGNNVSCCTQWSSQVYKTEAGSLTITIPASIPGFTLYCGAAQLPVQQNVIDFKTLYNDLPPTTVGQSTTITCAVAGHDGKSYGAINFNDLSGTRENKLNPGHIWSTNITVTQPNPAVTKCSWAAAVPTGDSDISTSYYTLWTLALTCPTQ